MQIGDCGMYHMSDRQANVFTKEMIITDGSNLKSGTKVIWGKKNRLENILGICSTHNISANIVKDKRGDYYISIHRSIENNKRSMIWGVTVKNGTVFTNHQGSPLLSSNSNNGVKALITHAILEFGGKVVLIQHHPPTMIAEIPEYCDMVLCGHVHEAWKYKRLEGSDIPIINMGVDVWNYMPINVEEVLAYYTKIQKKDGFEY